MGLAQRAARCGAVFLIAWAVAACGPSTPETAAKATTLDARMADELARADERGNMCSGREAKASGLRAEYFGRAELAGDVLLVRQEGPLDEPWPQAGQLVERAPQSARWSGWIRAPLSGKYAFHTDHPGALVVVAGQPLAQASDTVELAAGRYHPVRVELRRMASGTQAIPLNLAWTTPHGAKYPLPRAVLFPPSDTVDSPEATQAASSK